MKVFLSWSGPTSKAIAEALRDWLPNVIQAVEPWMSSDDIDKGTRWIVDLASRLAESHIGILCLAPDNLLAPWIIFEAGALSKTMHDSIVCTYLFNVEPERLPQPLSQFQATKANKDDTERLIFTINKALGNGGLSRTVLTKAFEVWWPELEKTLRNVPPAHDLTTLSRSQPEMLEEMLGLLQRLAADGEAVKPRKSRTEKRETPSSKRRQANAPRLKRLLEQFAHHYELRFQLDENEKGGDLAFPVNDQLVTVGFVFDSSDDSYEFVSALAVLPVERLNMLVHRMLQAEPVRGITERVDDSGKVVVVGGRENLKSLTETEIQSGWLDDLARVAMAKQQIDSLIDASNAATN